MFKWCPRVDLNYRHEDFQSTALPLSYSGTYFAMAKANAGSGRFRIGGACWQERICPVSVISDFVVGRPLEYCLPHQYQRLE